MYSSLIPSQFLLLILLKSDLCQKVCSAYHQIVKIKNSKNRNYLEEFSSFSCVFSWQFSKISQKIVKRNYLVCNYLEVGTVFHTLSYISLTISITYLYLSNIFPQIMKPAKKNDKKNRRSTTSSRVNLNLF